MRPPSVHAKPACTATPAGCPCDVARLLHGPHRVAARLVMILLSCQRWPPAAIAELLGYDPATVAAGSTATTSRALPGLKIDPAGADLGWAAHGSASGSVDCWPNPKRGRLVGSTSGLVVPR